jgi:hypothetical protein
MDRKVTVKQELISGHEPQMGLDTKTDWLTDRPTDWPSVAMWLWQLQTKCKWHLEAALWAQETAATLTYIYVALLSETRLKPHEKFFIPHYYFCRTDRFPGRKDISHKHVDLCCMCDTYAWQRPSLFIRDKPILSSEKMLHTDYDSKGSVANENLWSWYLRGLAPRRTD